MKIVKTVAIALTVVVGFYLGRCMGDKIVHFALDHVVALSCFAFLLYSITVIIDRVFKKYL